MRTRTGHSAPPSLLRYYADTWGDVILSAGADRSLRIVSQFRDSHNRELSQGIKHKLKNNLPNVSKHAPAPPPEAKLPQIIAIDNDSIRARKLDAVVTCHKDSHHAYSWSMSRGALGTFKLPAIHISDADLEKSSGLPVSFSSGMSLTLQLLLNQLTKASSNSKASLSLYDILRDISPATVSRIHAISCCLCCGGRYAVIGNSIGWCEVYNMESGRHEGTLRNNESLHKVW